MRARVTPEALRHHTAVIHGGRQRLERKWQFIDTQFVHADVEQLFGFGWLGHTGPPIRRVAANRAKQVFRAMIPCFASTGRMRLTLSGSVRT